MKDYSVFIGEDISAFIMRIFIRSTIQNGEYALIGSHYFQNIQKEVLIAYGARIKITAIDKCYVKLPEENNLEQNYDSVVTTSDLFINCWLIDCELLPFSDSLTQPLISTTLKSPYVASLTEEAVRLLLEEKIQERKDIEERKDTENTTLDYNNKYLINEHNTLNKLKMHGGKAETIIDLSQPYTNYFDSIKKPYKLDEPIKIEKQFNKLKSNKIINKEQIKQFDEYQKKVINNVNQNKFFMI